MISSTKDPTAAQKESEYPFAVFSCLEGIDDPSCVLRKGLGRLQCEFFRSLLGNPGEVVLS